MKSNEEEYKILKDNPEKIQKILNQWKHQYNLKIIQMTSPTIMEICILLTRTVKKD